MSVIFNLVGDCNCAMHAQTRLAETNTSADMDSAVILDSVSCKTELSENFWIALTDANKENKFDFSIIGGPLSPAIPN